MRSKTSYRRRQELVFVSPKITITLTDPSEPHPSHFVCKSKCRQLSSILMEFMSVSMNRYVGVGDLLVCFTVFLPCIGPPSTFHQGHLTTRKHPQTHTSTDALYHNRPDFFQILFSVCEVFAYTGVERALCCT